MNDRPFYRPRDSRRGFTLIELLVTIGLIAILIALLLPAVRLANDHAKGVVCQSHQRQLWQGFLAFAADHDQSLPGGWFDGQQPDPTHRDWLLGEYAWGNFNFTKAPESGTLFKYLNNAQVYRCPSLDVAPPRSVTSNSSGWEGASNGRFDYAVFLCFTGARLDRLPSQARLTYPATPTHPAYTEMLPTPVVVEEVPKSLNGLDIEGGHSNSDQMAHHHRGGSYYISTDGSAHWINEPGNAGANGWAARGSGGQWPNMGAFTDATTGDWVKWGYWNKQ